MKNLLSSNQLKIFLIAFVCSSIILILTIGSTNGKIVKTSFSTTQKEKKYLPVCLNINNYQVNDFYLYCSKYLKTKGIEVISKEKAKDISEHELKGLFEQYFRENIDANTLDFEDSKRRMANDLSYVVNQLSVKIKFDSVTNRVDSFTVSNFPLPFNLGNPYKRKWIHFDLSKIDTLPLANFAVAISDSIINANILFRER